MRSFSAATLGRATAAAESCGRAAEGRQESGHTAPPQAAPRHSLSCSSSAASGEPRAGDPQGLPDWGFKHKAYFGAIDMRYQAVIAVMEQAAGPILNAGRSNEEGQFSTQFYYVLVMLSSGAALDKCHNAGINEGF